MIEKYSAILEMCNGTRGLTEYIKPSAEYQKYMDECVSLQAKIKEKCKDDTELLTLLEKWENATMATEAVATDDFYREGFQFGLLMGIEVGMSVGKSR